MNSKVNPVVAVVIVVVVIAIAVLLGSRVIGSSGERYGAEIPDVVKKDALEHGPRPMPPIPMPGGGKVAPAGGAVGAPPSAPGK